jgi:hypothetical protein
MRSVIVMLFILVARPGSAQPPDTTDPAMKKIRDSRGTAMTASGTSPRTSSAPGGKADPTQAGSAGLESPERSGLFVLGSLGVASKGLAGDLYVGWTIRPWLNAFASIGGIVDGDSVPTSIKGLGVRLLRDQAFLELRVAIGSTPTGCEFDAPCIDETTFLGMVGVGMEFIHRRHVGLEIRGQAIFGADDPIVHGRRYAAFLVTLGLGLFL